MLISLIIPCYNEEAVLKLLFKELQKISIEMRTHDFEFLFINDGSSDGTLKILKEFSQEVQKNELHPDVKKALEEAKVLKSQLQEKIMCPIISIEELVERMK